VQIVETVSNFIDRSSFLRVFLCRLDDDLEKVIILYILSHVNVKHPN